MNDNLLGSAYGVGNNVVAQIKRGNRKIKVYKPNNRLARRIRFYVLRIFKYVIYDNLA